MKNGNVKKKSISSIGISDHAIMLELKGKNIPSELKFEFLNGYFRKPIIGDIEAADLIDQIVRYGGSVYEARQCEIYVNY